MATLIIIKGQTNWLTVTVSELTTSESPYYTFTFTGGQKTPEQTVVLLDESDFKKRYNLFKFIEGTDLKLKFKGQGEYKIFDSNGVQVEIGKVIVATETEAKKYSYPFPDKDNFLPS